MIKVALTFEHFGVFVIRDDARVVGSGSRQDGKIRCASHDESLIAAFSIMEDTKLLGASFWLEIAGYGFWTISYRPWKRGAHIVGPNGELTAKFEQLPRHLGLNYNCFLQSARSNVAKARVRRWWRYESEIECTVDICTNTILVAMMLIERDLSARSAGG